MYLFFLIEIVIIKEEILHCGVDDAAIAFGWSARASISHKKHHLIRCIQLVKFLLWRDVFDILLEILRTLTIRHLLNYAIGVDYGHSLERHYVATLHLARGLYLRTIDRYSTISARLGSIAASLECSDRPEPLVYSN